LAWLGLAWLGLAWLGFAWFRLALLGIAWFRLSSLRLACLRLALLTETGWSIVGNWTVYRRKDCSLLMETVLQIFIIFEPENAIFDEF